jgi:predicted HTH domain antitoxin
MEGKPSMEQQITIRIPRAWLAGVPVEERTLQDIFRKGLHQYRVERALELYRDGVGSLGYIAAQLGLSKRDLAQEARRRGIAPALSEETVREELA